MYQRISKISSKKLILSWLLIISIINLPYFILGQGFYDIFGYDNLDSNVISYKLLIGSGKLFANSADIIAQPLSGLARVGFPSELSFSTMLYAMFKPHVAYSINIFLIQLIAFLGMQLMLKRKYNSNNYFLIYAVSLIFSQLNFWPHAGISVAGLPLIYYAYITFKEKPVLSILIILFYSAYSNLVLVGIFLIAILSLDVLIRILKKEVFISYLFFILILCFAYLIVEYRLVLSVLNPVFISQRTEYVAPTFGFKEAFSTLLKMLFGEYGHNIKKPELIVLTAIVFIVFTLYRKNTIGKDIPKIIFLIFLLSAISVIMQSTFIYSFTSKVNFLRIIQLQRFYWLLPPLYYILFFLILEKINSFKWGRLAAMILLIVQFGYVVSSFSNWRWLLPPLFYVLFFLVLEKTNNLKWGRLLFLLFLIVQFGYVFSSNPNWRQIIKTKIFKMEAGGSTYNQFYSEKLYTDIKDFIGKEQASYRVASFGLQPAAALYNGFYTIDGYFGNFPIEQKRRFYEIMKKELDKNKIARDFFINYGLCIIISDEEIGRLNGKGFVILTFFKDEKNRIIHHLDINTKVMREMNCQYMFSAFQIENANEINMNFEKYFERVDSPYGIYLYSINKKQ